MKCKRVLMLALACTMSLGIFAGCGKTDNTQDAATVDLNTFQESVIQKHPFSNNFMEIATKEQDENNIAEILYPGLEDIAEEYVIYSSMVMQNSEMALVKAKDAESVPKVEELLQERVATMSREGVNYPEVVEVWETSSEVVANGDYVMLIAHTDVDDIVEEFEALFA